MSGASFMSVFGSLLVMAAGFITLLVSLPAIRKKEYLLLNSGLFFFLYGLRWFFETPYGSSLAGIGPEEGIPWIHSLLTYLIPVPFSGFLLSLIGPGLYQSMRYFFYSTIVYAVFAVFHDLVISGEALSPSINTVVLILWCMAGGINVILIRDQGNTERRVLRITLYLFLFCLAYDNLVIMNIVPWNFRLEHVDILILLSGWVYIAIRRLGQSEGSPR